MSSIMKGIVDEEVGGNYLYHSVQDADTAKAILNSGYLKANRTGSQVASDAQTELPVVSFSRNLNYALSGENVNRNYQVVLVFDRSNIEANYKTLSTSQSKEVRGSAYGGYSDKIRAKNSLKYDVDGDGQLTGKDADEVFRQGVMGKKSRQEIGQTLGQIKHDYHRPKAGGEFEEVVPVKSGKLPLNRILVGFYLVPGKAASKDEELLNNTMRLDMPKPNVFVKANQEQPVNEEELDENLRKWFKEKWVRFGPDGKIRGACARGSDKEGKPKCLPQSKAHSIGKKGRKYAGAKKRREDPNPERTGKAKNVATKKKTNEGWKMGAVGAATGANLGATVGTAMAPGMGTALGALIGAAAGAYNLSKIDNWEDFKIWFKSLGQVRNRSEKEQKIIDKAKTELEIYTENLGTLKQAVGEHINHTIPEIIKLIKYNQFVEAGAEFQGIRGTLFALRSWDIIDQRAETIKNKIKNKFGIIGSTATVLDKEYLIDLLTELQATLSTLNFGNAFPNQVKDAIINKKDNTPVITKSPNQSVNPELQKRLAARKAGKPTYSGGLEEGKKSNGGVPFDECPKCRGPIVHESMMNEKQDACYHKVKSRYKVWPSAYASGALVQCRKKGASNWGTGGKKDESSIMKGIVDEAKAKQYVKPYNNPQTGEQIGWVSSDGYHKKYWQKFAKDSAIKHAKLNPDEVQEHYTGQFAAEKTPTVNPHAGIKDNQFRGDISEDEQLGESFMQVSRINRVLKKHGFELYNDNMQGDHDNSVIRAEWHHPSGRKISTFTPNVGGGLLGNTYPSTYISVKLHGNGGMDEYKESTAEFLPTSPRELNRYLSSNNSSKVELDEKCWDTHKQVGMKTKGGKSVPNCVPKESAIMKGLKR